jgi:MSHA biogenesis protein MshG
MPGQFTYRAVARDGSHQVGTITATEVSAVEEFLHAQKLLPINIKAIGEKRPITLFGFLKSDEYENLIMFTSSLATMHRAGIPLLRALNVIRIGGPKSRFNFVIDRLRTEIQSGRMLSEAMDTYPDIFSSVYVSCVAAGEESGRLEQTLDELALMLEREMELTRQIKSGIRYPLIVISAIVGAFIVLINFVVPKFAAFYSTFNAQLPLPTRIILGVSHFCTTYWPLVLLAVIGAGIGFRMLIHNEQGRLWFDTQILRIPVLGGLIIRGSVARFSLMLQIMVAAGLPLVKSVTILAATVKNTAIAAEIRLLADVFRRGREVDIASGQFHLIPRQALQMLAIGLESGNLEAMLKEVGNHYTKQVLYTSRQLTSIIEPILTLVLGAFVLILALAIFLPMWNLIKVFQG